MNQLSPEARDLIELTRSGDDPRPGDRARMDAKLALVLAGGASGASAGSQSVQPANGKAAFAGAKLSWLVGGALVLAAATTLVLRSQPGAVHSPTRTPRAQVVKREPVRVAEPAAADTVPPPSAAEALQPSAASDVRAGDARAATRRAPARTRPATLETNTEPSSAQAPAASAPPSNLAREMALLASARSALRNHRPSEALDALAEHERAFPEGALREERLGTQALASCASSRYVQGRAYLRALLQLAPSSPLLARATAACHEREP